MLKQRCSIPVNRSQPLRLPNTFMKRTVIIFLVFVSVFAAGNAQAQPYRFALGVRLSNATPTLNNSITGKYFITDQNAIEGMVSFGSRFGIGGLLEIHKPLNIPQLSWMYGAGAFVGFQDNDTYLGPTGILGLDYKFEHVPINLSLDWKPELNIIPDIDFVPDAFALSVRFTLK